MGIARVSIGLTGLLVVAAWALAAGVPGSGAASEPRGEAGLAAGRCILCNAYGANNAPRVCNSCNSKFNNRCILCNAYGANIAPRICSSCNSKFSNRCILCNAYGANTMPRICSSCNSKH